MGVQVFMSINNNEEVIQLPVPPESYRVISPFLNEKYEAVAQTLNLIGIKDLKHFEISSFFPVRDYPFLQNRNMWGMEYVEALERWRERRIPVRIVIVSDDPTLELNMPVTIDSFEYETKKDGDIYYTMELSEFAFIKVGG